MSTDNNVEAIPENGIFRVFSELVNLEIVPFVLHDPRTAACK
jgi:hypothetical protein